MSPSDSGTPPDLSTTPASRLLGHVLDDGWKVIGEVAQTGTGGFFSQTYIVERGSTQAFLKALDIFKNPTPGLDPLQAMKDTTEAFLFERDLLLRCGDRKLDRIVRILSAGTFNVPGYGAVGAVHYLIFELAREDLRKRLGAPSFDFALRMRTFHHVAVGLRQLHSIRIAHQDLKPSNVLLFPELGPKIGDLGRASAFGVEGPFDKLIQPGARAYAPPEVRYGYADRDWACRRLGYDLFLLGSLGTLLVTTTTMQHLLFEKLTFDHRPERWGGTFEEVLPFLRDAFDQAIQDVESALPAATPRDFVAVIRELCEPDPRLRGDPVAALRGSDRLDLERYISRLNVIASEVEFTT